MPTLFPLLAIGAATLIWQVASARSIMSGLHGNELSLGLVLGGWLVLIGLSTLLGAACARRGPRRWLTHWLLLVPLGIALSLLLQHRLLPAYTAAGWVLPPGRALSLILLCLAPACLPLGGAFGACSRATPPGGTAAAWGARIYLLESAGTALAGLLFHFRLAQLPVPFAGLAAGALAWVAAFSLRVKLAGRWRWPAWCIAAAGLGALVYMIPGLPLPGASWLEPRVPGYRVLKRVSSRHGALAVISRGDQVLITNTGQVLFSNQEVARAEALMHATLVTHPSPRRVLLIGGGLGGGLGEVLSHPVEHIDYVELDPEVVALAREFGGEPVRRVLAHPRVHLHIADGRRFINERPGAFDVIMVGLPGPTSALANRFYTEEFFTRARAALRPGGIIRILLQGAEGYLSPEQALTHAAVLEALERGMGNSVIFPGGITMMLAGRGAPPDVRLPTLVARYRERGLAPARFSETELVAWALPFKREQVRRRLAQVSPLPNTDLHPAAYFNETLSWVARSAPHTSRFLVQCAQGARRWLPAGLAALFLILLLWSGLRGRRAAGLAIFSAGLTGMALELGLVLAAQEIRGVIYHELAVLLSAFMLGLALGAWVGAWLLGRLPRWSLAIAMVLVGAAALVCWGAARWAALSPSGALWILLLALTTLGLSVGACFPPAVHQISARRPGVAVGWAYAWDLLGGATGALVGSWFLIPVLGLPGLCLLCCVMCLASGLTVWR